ncbi:hypothetical protein V3851_13560 [Paenibacillus sp. M1]|uniref:Uncharacterized protein n=1 Tax=Paenibacillus haidiansis TaxID=1574488 RepID=A0ABU7VSX0_9BACL
MSSKPYKLAAMLPDKPLQLAEPALYRRLVSELTPLHLHPFDVKAGARSDPQGVTVYLRFGEELGQVVSERFTREQIDAGDPGIRAFFQGAAQAMKKALIADYYRMMKPEV